jgi:hypothetical protein
MGGNARSVVYPFTVFRFRLKLARRVEYVRARGKLCLYFSPWDRWEVMNGPEKNNRMRGAREGTEGPNNNSSFLNGKSRNIFSSSMSCGSPQE